MQAHEWEMRRLIERLPATPPECYVLSPRSLAWYMCLVPIDLRPMGGSIRLLQVRRDRPCIEAIRGCLLDLGQDISRPVLIRTGIGLFLPTASVLLLPEVDAFQVWPGPDVVAPLSDSDSLTQPPSNADRFALSLTMPHVAESSFHEASGSNAVVISGDGLFYVAAPSYCDHLTLRSAVLQAFLEEGGGDRRVPLHFARVLPPLDGLPSVQFAALRCTAGMSPALVDLRPMGGALQVFGASMYDTPAMRIQAAIARNGDPATGTLRARSLQQFSHHVDGFWFSLGAFIGFQEGVPLQVRSEEEADDSHYLFPALASVQEHYRLSLRLSFPDSLTRLSWIDAAGLPGRVHTMFCFSIASPAETFRFYLQGDRPFFQFKELLQQCSGRLGRGPAVLVSPMPLHRCVQFVAPPRELTHYTVLLDTGTRRYCVDVPHQGRGIRTGDVILAHADEDSKPFEVGPISIPLGANAVQISFFGLCTSAIGCTERALLKSLGKMLQLSLASPSGISLAAVYTVVLLLGRGQRSSLPLRGNVGICYTRATRNRRPPPSSGSDSDTEALEIELPEPAEVCPAWCHELACRHTHFATTADGLRHHLSRLAPYDTFQVAVWTPLDGPTLFEAPKQVTSGQFAYLLAAAGHRAADHRLHLAFDTQATVADVLSIPAGSSIWWIVRDGLARELLRPVAFWYEGHDRIAVTLNSHGQASGLIASPEVARLRALPQGARAYVGGPLTRVIGHLTASGLVLSELMVGSAVAVSVAPSSSRRPTRYLGFLLSLVIGTAMHIAPGNANNLAVSGPPALPQPWGCSSVQQPSIMRIWTHTLAGPLNVPYQASPDPSRLASWVFDTQRGVPAEGDFVWTTPRIVKGVAHLLHIPSGVAPPTPFWLLHFRGKGAVVAVQAPGFDWTFVAQQAVEAFGGDFFTKGAFGVHHCGRVFPFNTPLPVPPHGAIISLVRMTQPNHAGFSTWDAPPEACWVPQFEYDICMGPLGEPALSLRAIDNARHTGRGPARSPEGDNASLCHHSEMAAQLTQVTSRLQDLTTRLEASGVLAPTNGLDPGVSPWMFLLASELLGLPVDAAGAVTEDPTGPEAPVEPSSPSYSDLQAPTPDTTIEGEGLASTVRASDSVAASTMVPVDGPTVANVPAFDQSMVPAMQRRVAAHLQGVNVAPQGHPFLPHGCPITIHDPFSRGSTCELLTSSIATGLIFEEMLRDYVARRGWQPLVSVYPQPDALSVHLIPAAADIAQITVRGRRGRIREPYTASRDPNRPIHLRDGDCLHADVGPFGPPPPEPVRSSTSSFRLSPLLALGALFQHRAQLPRGLVFFGLVAHSWVTLGRLLSIALQVHVAQNTFLLWPVCGAVHLSRTDQRHATYSIGHYPWRLAPDDQVASHVSHAAGFRATYLCPWLGPQGDFQGPSTLTTAALARRYQGGDSAVAGLMPVWPGDRSDRLLFVPQLTEANPLVCVVARSEHCQRSLLLPPDSAYEQICRAVVYLARLEVGQVRLPPAVFALCGLRPNADIHLRTGDVLDVLAGRQEATCCRPTSVGQLKDSTLWTRPVLLSFPVPVYLWLPSLRQPIVHLLPAGTWWDPVSLSFDGPFRQSFAGRWVPVSWAPSHVVHMMQASDDANIVHVFLESQGQLVAQATDRCQTVARFAADRGLLSTELVVIGVPSMSADWRLRDGDIVFDNFLSDPQARPWDPLASASPSRTALGAITGACWIVTGSSACFVLVFSSWLPPTRAVRGRSRTPPDSSEDEFDCTVAPVGLWKPELTHPLESFPQRWDYHILCPFRGWSSCIQAPASTTHTDFQHITRRFCGGWVRGHLLLGPSRITGMGVVLPLPSAGLATIFVHAGGSSHAAVVPRHCCLDVLLRHLQRLCWPIGIWLRLPPALTRAQMPRDASLALRDGDTFSLELDMYHPAYRSQPSETVARVEHLNHLNLWHVPFRLRHGGWIFIWHDEDNLEHQCERHWVNAHSTWMPRWSQFVPPRGEPLADKIVPVPCLKEGECHFVRRSDFMEARVLMVDPLDASADECRLLSLSRLGCDIPFGWQHRPDIQIRNREGGLRDGDVLVPTSRVSARSRLADILAALGVAGFRGYSGLSLFLPLLCLSLPASSMFAPPQEVQGGAVGNIGMFPWRVPVEHRACHEAVPSEGCARLFSPFEADAPLVPVSPETLVEDLTINLVSCGPAWCTDLMPVWPNIWVPHINFLPAPDDRRLVCVLVVSPEWQLPVLIPKRTDLTWLLSYLRRLAPSATSTLYRPLQSAPSSAGPNEAVDWRNGDLFLAMGPSGSALHDQPSFSHGSAVRTSAVWSYDFFCTCALPVVVWIPGRRPSRTVLPPGSQWRANLAAFEGEFQQRYPGHWAPVPWAYSHDVHLCQRADDEVCCNVIVEELTDDKLRGNCHTVNTRISSRAFAVAWGVRPDKVRLLGLPGDHADWPPLRDGDILHFNSADRSEGVRASEVLCAVVACFLGHHPWFKGAIWLGCRLGTAVAMPTGAPPSGQPPHWLWSPYRGRLGPVLCSEEEEVRQWLHYLEPLWFRGHTKVHPSLEPYEHHWVPLLATDSLVTVLVLGAPRPLAVILPSRLTKRLLFKALKGLFPDMTSLVGNHPSLRSAASDGSEIRLRHGDLLATCTSRWQPSLDYHWRQHFSSPLEAQELGLWSHDLDFDGPGMAILHRAGDLFPLAIALEGTQKWDSQACTLRPALQGLLESWWPCTDITSSITNYIHFRAFSAPLESEAPAVMRISDAEPPADRIGDPHPPDLHHVPMPFSHGMRSSSICRALVVAGMVLSIGGLKGDTAAIRNLGPTHWSLVWLGVYLAAFGAPRWEKSVDCWQADLSDVCHLQAAMHETWWTRSQRLALPSPLPPAYHASWQLSPAWSGGVPDSLLIATDGSGVGSGSWAFAVWGLFAGVWHRIDWEAGTLPQANWMPEGVSEGGADTRSYRGELAALQAAAMWCLANLDLWAMHMGSMPRLLTIAVDNSSAMQVAAGHAATDQLGAAETRAVWQAVQARISTSFQHVHSHTGVFVNTIVDALATWVLHAKAHPSLASSRWAHEFSPLSPWLWLVAKAKVVEGCPTYRMPIGLGQWCPPAPPDVPDSDIVPRPAPVPLCAATANVQSLKDSSPNPFNPAGHAARRQHLMEQASALGIDILCIQEARSRPGRWSVAGWHTWRSGAEKGQYGCEIWVNPRLVTPALHLSDWRILLSTPRILVITCLFSLLPVTICSAHAPHADRPDREATEFWALLTQTLQEAPRYRALLIGLDANGDFCSADEDDHLIGTLVSQAEPARNDDCLLEMCLRLGLVAPATFPDTQLGEGWSWQHTSSKRKRLDHLLFQAGPWEIARTSQALAFDIVNVQRDHMALWAQATLHAAAPQGRRDAPRRCLPSEVIQGGQAIWKGVRLDGWSCTGELVQSLLDGYGAWRKALPSRPPLTPKQPYIQATTLGHLNRLRDWRAQVRHVKSEGARLLLHLCFQGWKQQGFPDRHAHLQWHQHRLLEAAMLSQEYHLSRRAHNSAKRDKAWYFLQLTHQATDLWHRHGCAMESIVKLRWASRRAAERRAVHAAGGYNIDAALEEQFREQEGGRFVTAQQLRLTQLAWDASPTNPCPEAVPTLLQMESACRRQQGSKAPGPDLVLNELWRHYPVQAGQWFWLICTQTALTGREPPHFKLALICALYKKGPAALPQNYRSIALMNGMAKVYHGFLRRGVGHSILAQYRGLQLGGRPGVPVSFAVAAFRSAWALSVEAHRSCAILYVDIRAAYYEASRDLIFQGGELGLQPDEGRLWHLASLVTCLRCDGALHLLGVPADEIALLQDCVACAHWQLVGSDRYVLATRGSRPGDGLADVLFGALFAIALRHIDDTCCAEGLACHSASIASGAEATPVSIGWADDLAIITDYTSPRELQQAFPRVAEIVLDTLHALRFKVNLGLGKTEALLDIRGPEAKAVRGELLGHGGPWQLPNGAELRVTPEYRYLGVVQQVKDTGRRDTELSAQRGRTAWMHGRNLLSSESVPWALKQAWVAGRILPAAYATLATCIAVSERATAPLEGLFERLARTVVGSWRFGHVLHRASLLCLLGLSSPAQAVLIARARLTVQLVHKAPQPVWRLFDTAWNHAVPWCELLADACRAVARGVPGRCGRFVTTSLAFVRDNQRGLLNACRFLSRWGTLHSAFHDLWHDLDGPRMRKVLGPSVQAICPLCRAALPSAQALAAHVHRKHSVVNWLTRYTHGTACLWCHHEMHSTDRLKYHLRTNPSCVHGLRVTVGEVYEYGIGTRRGGPRGHRGVPAIRLPGPLNATPAQRRAAEAGRACSVAELATELRQVVGAAHVYDWPPLPEPLVQLADHRMQAPHVEQLPVPPISQPSEVISSALGPAAPQSLRWRCVHDYDETPTNWAVPSMLWSAKDVGHTVWQLPRTWHRYWNCWKAASSLHPWDEAAKGPLRALRGAASHHTPCARDPPLPLLCLLAATVSFRHICARVRLGGALWLWGLPSATGTAVLRALLPSAVFSRLCLSGRTVFVAHHPCCPRVWQPALAALCAPVPGGPSPAVLPVGASLIFRSESLGRS
ncbi:unnamed protein product [Symbiodinium sp. CCMP2592]|nr:unnamed protein product [Symbiodinium sp. CCMP2592]